MLITLEGIDGSGKSTVARHIASRLAEALPERRLVLTAEPTTGQVGRILRAELAKESNTQIEAEINAKINAEIKAEIEKKNTSAQRMQELFLFMADHAHHLTKTVIPSLKAGSIVLSDRYADSTAAYQGVTLRGIVPDPVSWIQSIYRPWNLLPDRTLLFVLDPRTALRRMQSRQEREKFERLDFLRMVDENFRRMADREAERFVLIDAEQDTKKVAEEALKAILNLISSS